MEIRSGQQCAQLMYQEGTWELQLPDLTVFKEKVEIWIFEMKYCSF